MRQSEKGFNSESERERERERERTRESERECKRGTETKKESNNKLTFEDFAAGRVARAFASHSLLFLPCCATLLAAVGTRECGLEIGDGQL